MNFEQKLKEIYEQPKLPEGLNYNYNILSCLKYTDHKQIYLIENKVGNSYILKCADGVYAPLLKKERLLLETADKVIDCPKVVAFSEGADESWIVKEYIPGETIGEIVGKRQLSESEVFAITEKVCEVLKSLHTLEPPVIVRDIKPENIVMCDSRCVFIDFDAAREWSEDNLTDTVCMGTRTTAAPEQFGYSQTDVRTDVYSVGMLMTFMLTGGYDISYIKPGKAQRIVKKCTQFSPDKRYLSVSAICDAIHSRKRRIAACAAAAVVAVVLVLGGIIWNKAQDGDEYTISPTNNYSFTMQASSRTDKMVADAIGLIDRQSIGTVRAGRTKRQMVEYLLNDSQYAVFDGEIWPCRATMDEDMFISYVTDACLADIDGTIRIKLDTKSSASMSTGWYVSAVVYTEDISMQSYRVYIDGAVGKFEAAQLAEFFKKHLQAGEHIRIDETRSMSFVSCDDDGFYFIEYGSDDNSDCHLRLRYYSFCEFADYLNAIGKQIWYYEIDPLLNE